MLISKPDHDFSANKGVLDMKNNKDDNDIEIILETDEDEPPSSCETRRKIEDLLELRRYQDELGNYDEIFDLPLTEKV